VLRPSRLIVLRYVCSSGRSFVALFYAAHGTIRSNVLSNDHLRRGCRSHSLAQVSPQAYLSKRTMPTPLVSSCISPQPMCSILLRLNVRYPAFNTPERPLRLDQAYHQTTRSQGPGQCQDQSRYSARCESGHPRLHEPRTAVQSMNGMVRPVRPMTPNSSADKGVVSARVCD